MSRWLVCSHWLRSGVWTLRVVTAGGALTEHGAASVTCSGSSPGAGEQEAAVTQLGAGESAAEA